MLHQFAPHTNEVCKSETLAIVCSVKLGPSHVNFSGRPLAFLSECIFVGLHRFLDANPEGKVPVIKNEGKFLADSDVITQLLEEKFPEPSLKTPEGDSSV